MTTQRVSCDAQISTLKMGLMDRALAKLTKVDMPSAPADAASADLAADGFFTLYQGLDRRDPVPPERAINGRLLDWAQGMASWGELERTCRGHLPAALTATPMLWTALTSDEALQEALKRQEEAAQAEAEAQAAEAAAQMVAQAAEGGEGENRINPEMAAQMAAEAAERRAAAEAKAAAAQAQMNRIEQNALRRATLASNLRKAEGKAAEVKAAGAGWGFGPGSFSKSDPEQALAYTRRLSKKIREIAQMAGRMRGLGFQARRQQVVVGVEPTDVEFTQDILRIMPVELARMSPDAPAGLRELQIVRFVEDGLMGWQLMGSQEERGPFVAGVDCSGSMAGVFEIRAKGIALGLAQLAKEDRRPYRLFSFASDHDPVVEVSSDEGWAEHLTWGERFQNGGTSFDKALEVAMARLGEMGKAGHHADLLFISDGEAGVSPDMALRWQTFAEETGARLFYIAVGGHTGLGSIDLLAERTLHFAQLTQEAADQAAQRAGTWLQ